MPGRNNKKHYLSAFTESVARTSANYLFDLLDLLVEAPNHIICRVRNFFYFHQTHKRVNLHKRLQCLRASPASNVMWATMSIVQRDRGQDHGEGPDLCGEQVVQGVAVILEGDAGPRRDLCDVYALVQIHDILAFWIHLDQYLVLPHDLDNLSHIRARLLQELKLLPQKPHC